MKSIFTALAPNYESDDAWLATKLQFLPWRWKRGAALDELDKQMVLFDSGRTALEAILRCAGITSPSDEVLLQAFTCVAVPNAVIWAGAKPVYVDCGEDFLIDRQDLQKKLSPRTKAVIVQHTFGIMADVAAIREIVGPDVLIIEDCAHSYASSGLGDAHFVSFGRDKAVSAVFGGGAAPRDPELHARLAAYQASLPMPSFWWILRQLKYTTTIYLARVSFDFGIGKLLVWLVRHTGNAPVKNSEKFSRKPANLGKQMPNALAVLALHQISKLETFDSHRRKIAAIYKRAFPQGAGTLRFALRVSTIRKLYKIFLGSWYNQAIDPRGVDYAAIGYDPSTCPTAERLAGHVINLPTDIHITEHDAERIISTIKRLGGV